jgi:isoquinoline 1-oxidoreductase alpha subunit
MAATRFILNGREHTLDADPETPLLWALRDHLGLTGTKYGCGEGICGVCSVLLDGQAVRSCQTPLGQVAGKRVTTIEGLAAEQPGLQRAWLEEDVAQCGYCQPAMLLAAAALLKAKPRPSAAEVRTALAGMVCRCGSYLRIERAVLRASGQGGRP